MSLFNLFLKSVNHLLGRLTSEQSVFKSSEGEALYRSAYDAALQLWSAPHESIFVPTRFGRTHVIASGIAQGKPIVFLHGVLAGGTMWFPQANVLSEEYRIYAVDVLGDVNLSVPTTLPKTRVETAEWLTAVFDGLGIKQATVVGISLGGFLAINLALYAPQRVSRFVILDPAASLAPYSLSFMLRTIPNAFAAIFSDHPMDSIVKWAAANGKIVEQATPIMRQMDIALKHGRMRLKTLPTVFRDDELRRLQTPMLLLLGERSVIYDPQAAVNRAKRLIKGVRAEFIPESGHLLTFEQPELVTNRIREFLIDRESSE